MLLLVTIGLVLVGTVSLVIGFVSGHQGPIYITIVCSLVAGTTLAIFSRMSRRAAAGDAAPSTSGFTPETSEPDVAVIEDEPTQAVSAVAAGADFPIDDYDELLVSEILPVLPELDLDELDQVRDQEAAGKNRSSIIKRIDQLIDQFEDDGGVATPDADLDEDLEDVAGEVEDDADEIEGNPIPGYGKLSVAQILPLLDDLSDEDLDAVALYEEQHDNRKTIIEHIDSMFEEVPVDEPAPVKKAPAKTAAKKAPANASAKKAPAKAVAKTPAKTAAKKAPAKTAAKKAPAKAASKKVAATTKATAKKAPAKKTAAKSTKKR